MKYSQLVGKTKKQVSQGEESINAQLLIRGGFIQKQMAGVFAFLPLGIKVMNKITNVIRAEMNSLGANEILMGALQNKLLFEQSGRWSDEVVDVWFKTKFKNGSDTGLGFSHEEPLVDLLKSEINSYKDLPVYAYQFQNKFRNELRSRGGLLRTREFIMKDMYSFHLDQQDLDEFYEKVKIAYLNIFNNLGIGDKTFLTFASGGVFSKFSHEFQTLCSSGEDIIYFDTIKKIAINKEVFNDKVITELGLDKNNLQELKSVEVGNIFKLGTKFTQSGELKISNDNDEKIYPVMGCYGIGVARVMATIVEVYNDEKGILWPKQVAPFDIHLLGLNLQDSNVLLKTNEIYLDLTKMGFEVLFDDRININSGQKFLDADLIGCPFRIVVSDKTKDQIEIKSRKKIESALIDLKDIKNYILKN